MKFGVREICDVVLKAKATQKIGNKVFYRNEPVIYFDSLKTSSLEGASTTVYAQGGRGNSRLIAWEGERTVTFTMEDALISPVGFMILSGAGLIDAANDTPIYVHTTEQLLLKEGTNASGLGTNEVTISLAAEPAHNLANEDQIYVMVLDSHGEVSTEPYIAAIQTGEGADPSKIVIKATSGLNGRKVSEGYALNDENTFKKLFVDGAVILVDFYVEKKSNAQQIEITPETFGGNFYLEASTLFRDTDGVDHPAEFIIPNCKVQSNFTFTMASSGDPSTFTFTMDAFPDYTRFDPTKKVLCAIQIISESATGEKLDGRRVQTFALDEGKPVLD